MSDNQFDIVEYKNFLVDLANSDDPVFQEYSLKVQAALTEFEEVELGKLRNGIIEKWKKNLNIYKSSSDSEVSNYSTVVLNEYLKLISGTITLEGFKNSTDLSANKEKLEINSINYIKEQIVKAFE